jgi:hypothetical protein
MARLGFSPSDLSHFSKWVLMNDSQRNIASKAKLRIIERCSGEFDRDSRWSLPLVEQSASLPNFRIRSIPKEVGS